VASLFAPGVAVTKQRMREVMEQQGQDDPRPIFLSWLAGARDWESRPQLRRAAEMGYAPAQTQLFREQKESRFDEDDDEEECLWVRRAAVQGDRRGVYELACFLLDQDHASAKDKELAKKMIQLAASWDLSPAYFKLGELTYTETDWERFLLMGASALRGCAREEFHQAVFSALPSFEEGRLGRVLHVAAPLLIATFRAWRKEESCRFFFDEQTRAKYLRVQELLLEMFVRARAAIDCWSMAGRRLRVVKDMRVMIAKMAWEEVWRWGERAANSAGAKGQKKTRKTRRRR
jgi:hypothetical protein